MRGGHKTDLKDTGQDRTEPNSSPRGWRPMTGDEMGRRSDGEDWNITVCWNVKP